MIDEVHSQISSIFIEWDEWLVNPRFARRGTQVSWTGYEPWRFPVHPSLDDLIHCEARRQYSFQVSLDGGIFQLFYQFDAAGAGLVSASVGFYRPSSELWVRRSGAIHEACEWLRIDFRPGHARPFVHERCHLHTSSIHPGRMALRQVPTPRQFVDVVALWFYPDVFDATALVENRMSQDRQLRCREECPQSGELLELPYPILALGMH